jgi:hypothetical protein
MSEIAANIAKVRARLQQAQRARERAKTGTENPVRLLAVSKQQPAAAIREAHRAGLNEFGENYLQEAVQKMNDLADLPLSWHFIGPLQSNKTRDVAERFDWLHSLDRLKIARRLSAQRPAHLPPLNVCLQVNIDGETSKSGVSPQQVAELAGSVVQLPGLKLRGLMAIPRPASGPAPGGENGLESAFDQMARLFRQLQQQFPDQPVDTLSMGMSADLEQAVAAGSTLVRIGTDIFGPRS